MKKKNYLSLAVSLYLSVAILVYTISFSVLTILRHQTLQTGIYDLGIFDQILWNTINGRLLNTSVVAENILGVHFSPILIFIAPLYWIWANPKILLVFQSFVLAIGAVPLYLLANKRLNDTKLALSLSTAYLLSLHLHGVNLFDFHPVALVVPLLFFAFYFLEKDKYILFAIFLTFSFMCREEILLIGFVIGLYIAATKKKVNPTDLSMGTSKYPSQHRLIGGLCNGVKTGVSISIFSILAFLIIAYIVIPYFGGGPYPYLLSEYKYYTLENKTLYEIIKVVFIPHKIKYILSLFLPVAGFPLLSGWGLLLIIPQMAGVLLSSFRPLFTIGFYQYSAPIIPIIFILTVFGISNLTSSSFFTNKKRKVMLSYMISGYLIMSGAIFNLLWFGKCFQLDKYKITEHHQLIHKIKKLIPQDASLIANNRIGAHFSQRREIYNFEDLVEWPDRAKKRTDYIIVDTKTLHHYKSTINKLKETLSAKKYGVMYYEDGYVILKKGYGPRRNDEILASH